MKRCIAKQFLAVCAGLCITQTTFGDEPVSEAIPFWLPLAQDELHDPADPALNLLQNLLKHFLCLPRDGAGDQVNWVKAWTVQYQALINIRSNTQVEVLDLDVLLRNTDEMAW